MQTSDEAAKNICGLMELNERRLGTIKEATQLMHEAMAAARATGKAAKVSISFTVSPDKNDELALVITADVASKIPQPERKKALVYHDAEAKAFTKTDPRQLELLAEKEAERQERAERLAEAGIERLDRVGRGPVAASA